MKAEQNEPTENTPLEGHPHIPEPELISMEFSKERGFNFAVKHPVVADLTESLVAMFKEAGATNFLEMRFVHDELGELSLVLQRADGLTPAEKCIKLEKEIEALKKQLKS